MHSAVARAPLEPDEAMPMRIGPVTANWQPIPLVAAGLGIPEQTIRTWIRRGHVGSCSLPDGTLLVDTAAVLARRYPSSARAYTA